MPSLQLLRKSLATNEAGPSSGASAMQLRFCCFLVQLAGHEVVENEGRGARARAWSGAHGDRAWSADVGIVAWVT
ncbi:hypothetical protein ERO13_A09G145500v2 [Gossypium hirsutum]|uniref:Uncharacterized protein n=1 Tax=Gossypium darwinii TaxID=34276 RepID=A0A5D2FA12_GOSDA|nr:hypothetical protein ERO13_A09G145500v2 [Gossypium hirsutum]TYH02894.1 hypothetical protein ES288_A09G177000v1 [Gossypium darwinii]